MGVDIDPLAVAVARTALMLWAAERGPVPRFTNVVRGDSLAEGPEVWRRLARAGDEYDAAVLPAEGFDVVVGNPPFQNQLAAGTARDGEHADRLRERFGPAAYRYTDSALLFLLESCRWVRPGGAVSLVLPQSVLVAGDARAAREAVLDLGAIEAIWLAHEQIFTVPVRVSRAGRPRSLEASRRRRSPVRSAGASSRHRRSSWRRARSRAPRTGRRCWSGWTGSPGSSCPPNPPWRRSAMPPPAFGTSSTGCSRSSARPPTAQAGAWPVC